MRNPPNTIFIHMSRRPVWAIGDIIIHFPFFRTLRAWAPDAHITVVPGIEGLGYFEGLLGPLTQSMVDEVITTHIPTPDQGHYDWVFDLEGDTKFSFNLRRLANQRFFTTAGYGILNLPNLPIYHGKHAAKRFLGLARQATQYKQPVDHWPHPVPSEWKAAAKTLLPPGDTYVAMAPGSGNPNANKCWPLDQFVALAKHQVNLGRTPLVFIGPQDEECQSAFSEVPGARLPLQEATDMNLGVPADPALTVALASRCSAAVSNCSGPGHMFATSGVPLVSIFGPTKLNKLAPFARKGICLRPPDPKSKDISKVSIDSVNEAIESIIEDPPPNLT
jgi:ADP-heptose:LPS heptosyltransferase